MQLGNLICIYDDNRITIDENINCSFTKDVVKRCEAYGWHVVTVEDGNTDLSAIEAAIQACKQERTRPSIIKLRATIGYGSLEGTHGVHGNPLKTDDIRQLKAKWGFNADQTFHVPEEVYQLYHDRAAEDLAAKQAWDSLLASYANKYPELHADFQRRSAGKLPQGWDAVLPSFSPSDPAVATRKLSETILSKIYDFVPELIGGSSDLTPSNLTRWTSAVDFQAPGLEDVAGGYSGRYLRYGVREHAMGAIMNGLTAYETVLPYGRTFLNFVSYAAGAVRLSALSRLRVIWVATHDSIALGQDEPTYQPIETLAHFRAMPNCSVWRPADGNETSAAYLVALKSTRTPSILALSRQNLPQLHGSSIDKASRGSYVVSECDGSADITLVGTGSEVALCVEAAKYLREKYQMNARIVSLPCWEVFDAQSEDYKRSVLGSDVPSLSVEALSTLGWQQWTHQQFAIDTFDASAPADVLFDKFGFTREGLARRAIATIEFSRKRKKSFGSPLDCAF